MSAARLMLAAIAAIHVAAPLSAQLCGGTAREAGLVAGPVFYDMGAGIDGIEIGVTAALATDKVGVGVSASRIDLGDTAVDPSAVRAWLSYPALTYGDWNVCVTGHGGLSWLGDDEADALILAGGAGLAVARPFSLGGTEAAFRVEGRGLAASATGSALGLDLSAVGFSLGGATGLSVWLGPARLDASVTLDGFAGGLGPTPYPHQAYRLGASFGF